MIRRGTTVAQAVAAVLAGGAGTFAVPQFAQAQEVVAPQGVLEEVVVSAQRRDQALQDVLILQKPNAARATAYKRCI